jgi:hypothetical protein
MYLEDGKIIRDKEILIKNKKIHFFINDNGCKQWKPGHSFDKWLHVPAKLMKKSVNL